MTTTPDRRPGSPGRFRRTARAGAVLIAAGAVLMTAMSAPADARPRPTPVHPAATHVSCAKAGAGQVRCFSNWEPGRRRSATTSAVAGPVNGLRPADVRKAYQLPATGGAGQTIAIVDAFDNPNAEKDLAVYRAAFGLPACTTANGCFRKVDQRGGKAYPEGDAGWGVEIALDVQAVSAVCSSCKILLVEADTPSFDDIGAAVNTAVRLGAKVVSNSYGADEFGSAAALGKKYYTHAGVPILASSGDFGFTAASFPAVLPYVWAIGGTTIAGTQRRGFTETAWEGAGSGCSAYFAKPSWQHDPNCQLRTVSDVSAVADFKDGFAVYDTYGLGADNGWINVGGTSLSSPLVAGMIGLAGNASTVASPGYLYSHRSGLKDVVGGSNGYCGGDYLCTGVKGYDGPTGLGSPHGLGSL